MAFFRGGGLRVDSFYNAYLSPTAFFLFGHRQMTGQLLIQAEQMLHTLTIIRKAITFVETVDRIIERTMRLSQVRRHRVGIVKVRQRGTRMRLPGVENRLRESAYLVLSGFGGFRPREGVVNNAD